MPRRYDLLFQSHLYCCHSHKCRQWMNRQRIWIWISNWGGPQKKTDKTRFVSCSFIILVSCDYVCIIHFNMNKWKWMIVHTNDKSSSQAIEINFDWEFWEHNLFSYSQHNFTMQFFLFEFFSKFVRVLMKWFPFIFVSNDTQNIRCNNCTT